MAAERKCQKCTAGIPTQDINQGRAGFLSGKLLCAGCVQKKRQAIAAAKIQAKQAKGAEGSEGVVEATPVAQGEDAVEAIPVEAAEDAPIPMEPGGGGEVGGSTRIQRTEGSLGLVFDDSKLKRPVTVTGKGATRCRVFHTKLNDGAIAYMLEGINDWVDNNEIEIKQSQSTVGIFHGKTAEEHLLITIFY